MVFLSEVEGPHDDSSIYNKCSIHNTPSIQGILRQAQY
jgi:hypothetical protein